jgi:sarcosine oxidase subunit beta
MSMDPGSVVIVGAGALGLCTAWHLTERGVTDVTVIERGHVAGASSGLSVGIIETQYLDPLAIEVRVESMRSFAVLERSGALEIVRNGYLRLGHRDEDLEAFARSVAIQRDLGVSDCRVLDAGELRRLVPDLRVDDLAGGLFGPSDGYVDGHAYCDVLAAAVRARGGRVLQDTELLGCDPVPEERHRLRTSQGTVDCDVVVNAAGGWAGRVGDILGAPVEILPQRHQALMGRLPTPLAYAMPSIMDYVPSSGGFGVYIRDDGPGRFIAGLHTEEVIHDIVDPDDAGREAPDTYVDLVGERLAHRLPGLLDMSLGDVWAGIYPMRPDGRPVVGPHPGRPSVVTVAGAGGSGLQSSPALGRIAAEWILDGRPVTIPGAVAFRPTTRPGDA